MTGRALLVVLTFALAGCADEPPATRDQPMEPDLDEAGPSDLGGVVVTDAIVPIPGATVTLLPDGSQQTTDDDGEFLFPGLEQGTYVVEASAPGYLSRQVQAEVGDETETISIVLPIDPDGIPYVETDVWQGHISCSAYLVAALVAACDPLGQAGIIDDEFTTLIDVQVNIKLLQSELIWESNQDLGDTLQILMSYASQSTHDGGSTDGDFFSGTGESPILVKIPGESAQAVDLGNTYELKPRIFAGRSAQTQQMAGLTLQQDFTLFTHVFHGYMPPFDWRFSEEPKVPEP